jgi:MFS transporter, putative metabolite:H+ symporter
MALQDTADARNPWRFISAVGLGVELVTIDAYLSELVPKGSRGKAFALLLGISAIAPPVIYFISWKLVPIAPFGIGGVGSYGSALPARSSCGRSGSACPTARAGSPSRAGSTRPSG